MFVIKCNIHLSNLPPILSNIFLKVFSLQRFSTNFPFYNSKTIIILKSEKSDEKCKKEILSMLPHVIMF